MGGESKLDSLTGVGTVLSGKYRVERVVGSGGMGAVAVARHLRLGSRVAVKFMLPRPDDSERSVARFLREARTASRITSSHVARVFDVDLREDGVPYIVMEYLEGETLASTLRRESALPVEGSVDDVLAACEALTEAHALGIVHRDLKPGNLFRARLAGRPHHLLKVLDFGISKTFDSQPEEAASVTTGKGFIGSPPYMSPEQITAPGQVDSRTDVWSLGVVLYECLTGISPFSAPTVGATCARILHEAPRPPSELRPGLPAALDRCVLRALARLAGERHQTVLELARELAPFGTDASSRTLSSIESLREHAASAAELEPSAVQGRPELSTETAFDPVASLAGVMQSSFLRMPRRVGIGVGGGLALVVVGGVVLGTRWLGSSGDEVRTFDRPVAATAVPSPAIAPALPSPPASGGDQREPPPSTQAKAAPNVPAKVGPRPRLAATPAAPSSAPQKPPPLPAAPPPASVAPSDPEAIYTDRK